MRYTGDRREPHCGITVGESVNWEVLMAWKGAADLLWQLNQRGEAKRFYARIVQHFGKNSASPAIQRVVCGSKARLAE